MKIEETTPRPEPRSFRIDVGADELRALCTLIEEGSKMLFLRAPYTGDRGLRVLNIDGVNFTEMAECFHRMLTTRK